MVAPTPFLGLLNVIFDTLIYYLLSFIYSLRKKEGFHENIPQ